MIKIVTGAPGTGKTTIVEELLKMDSDLLFFDVDWLAQTAGELAGASIYEDSNTWKAYRRLWFQFVEMVRKNGKRAILFIPLTKEDLKQLGTPRLKDVEWLLLTCSDRARMDRLRERKGWTLRSIEEALDDAAMLKQQHNQVVDTTDSTPENSAREVLRWAAGG